MKEYVSNGVKNFTYIYVGIVILANYFINTEESGSVAYAMGKSMVYFFGFFIAYLCANKCVEWAGKIKRSGNVAYLIGFIGGPIGLFFYWIYRKRIR